MIAFPEMLVPAAKKNNIEIPTDLEKYDVNKFKRWHIFTLIQLGSPMPKSTSHFTNARIISELPEEELETVTYNQLKAMGLEVGYSK